MRVTAGEAVSVHQASVVVHNSGRMSIATGRAARGGMRGVVVATGAGGESAEGVGEMAGCKGWRFQGLVRGCRRKVLLGRGLEAYTMEVVAVGHCIV
eukprot:1143419-Pelagomonas_calceolata.AAC.3